MKTFLLASCLSLVPCTAEAHLLDFLFGPPRPVVYVQPYYGYPQTIVMPVVQYQTYQLQQIPVQSYQWAYVPMSIQHEQSR